MKIVELLKLVGNASQALAIWEKVQKVDKAGVKGTPDLQELIDKAKALPGMLDAFNKHCISMFQLYEGLVEEINAILKAAAPKGK